MKQDSRRLERHVPALSQENEMYSLIETLTFPPSSSGSGLAAFASSLLARLGRRRAARHLEVLPDYLLKDIGISRGAIEHAVRGDIKGTNTAFYPAPSSARSSRSRVQAGWLT